MKEHLVAKYFSALWDFGFMLGLRPSKQHRGTDCRLILSDTPKGDRQSVARVIGGGVRQGRIARKEKQ